MCVERPWMRAALAVVISIVLAARTLAGVATFENFNEGESFFGSFTDPLSGITFTDSTGPDPGHFVIEFTGPQPGLPTTSPGNFLSTSGIAPGPGLSLAFQFGSRGILPEPADLVFMSAVYATKPGAMLFMEGFDASGSLVASSMVFPPPGDFIETQIGVQSPSLNIHSFRVTATNIFVGYDNVTFVPEPTTGALVCVICLAAGRRRPVTRPLR